MELPQEVRLVLLVSDGVGQAAVRRLCRIQHDDPQALADALVEAGEEDGDGYRDDATVIALLRPAG
ncbi:hypothetical protein ACPCI0_31860 [Streptomyces griseoincarnatus]